MFKWLILFCCRVREFLRPHAGALFLRCKGTTFALRLTNDSAIIFEIFFAVMAVMVKMVKIVSGVKNRHYNINILFIYSEQNDRFGIHFDQNDLDHRDPARNAVKRC